MSHPDARHTLCNALSNCFKMPPGKVVHFVARALGVKGSESQNGTLCENLLRFDKNLVKKCQAIVQTSQAFA